MNLFTRNAKREGQNPSVSFRHRVKLANSYNLFFSQFMVVVLFSLSASTTTLSSHVAHVLFVSPEPQMIGTNTKGVITQRTVMKDMLSIGNGSVMQDPARDVCADTATARSPTDLTVPTCRFGGSPNPARVRLSDLVPKSYGEVLRKPLLCEVLGSYRNHDSVLARCALQGPPSFPFSNSFPLPFQQAVGVIESLSGGYG